VAALARRSDQPETGPRCPPWVESSGRTSATGQKRSFPSVPVLGARLTWHHVPSSLARVKLRVPCSVPVMSMRRVDHEADDCANNRDKPHQQYLKRALLRSQEVAADKLHGGDKVQPARNDQTNQLPAHISPIGKWLRYVAPKTALVEPRKAAPWEIRVRMSASGRKRTLAAPGAQQHCAAHALRCGAMLLRPTRCRDWRSRYSNNGKSAPAAANKGDSPLIPPELFHDE